MRACAELSFVCFLVDFFGYGGGGNTNTHVHVGPFFFGNAVSLSFACDDCLVPFSPFTCSTYVSFSRMFLV